MCMPFHAHSYSCSLMCTLSHRHQQISISHSSANSGAKLHTTDGCRLCTTDSCRLCTTDSCRLCTTDSCRLCTTDGCRLSTTDGWRLSTTDGCKLCTTDGCKLCTTDGCKLCTTDGCRFCTTDGCRLCTTDGCRLCTTDGCRLCTTDGCMTASKQYDESVLCCNVYHSLVLWCWLLWEISKVIPSQNVKAPCLKKRKSTFLSLVGNLGHLTWVKPVLNWANICSTKHSSEYSSNFTSFLNWAHS